MSLKAGHESIGDSRAGVALVRGELIPLLGVLLGAVTLMATLWLAPAGLVPTADAGQYSVWSCRGPDGSPVSTEAWRLSERNAVATDFSLSDDCLTGGSLDAESAASGLGAKSQAWATFELPRGDTITGYTVWRYLHAPVVFGGTYVSAIRETSGGASVDDGCASTLVIPIYNCSTSGSISDPLDPSNEHFRPGVSLSGLDLYTGCASNSCPPTAPFPGSAFRLYRSEVQIADNFAPTVVSAGGTVTGPEPVSGRASLTITGSDPGSGIAGFSLLMDGALVAAGAPDGSPPTCSLPYTVARPCLAGGSRTFTFDTGTMSPGGHSASGTIIDAAGNSTAWGPVNFTVAEPGVPVPVPDNGVPATTTSRLRIDRAMVDHRPGRNAIISGRLVTAAGIPVAGATLTASLVNVASRNQAEKPLPATVTDSGGRFRIPVKGGGAKKVTVSYAPIKGGVPVATISATARARIAIRLKRRPARVKRGQKVTFRGKVAGGGPAVEGANVEVQAIVSGRWRTIANVTARRNGAFVWPYRFRYVERNAIFSFRAVVRRTPGWPWPTLRSKRVKVRVNGAR
ncbi:MAG: carboxypeptidase-like regulatory domain-containing protein [Actinomycetota bacterium]|nr:carboxypeptidase-like regulatory domain-containing protein [Actinomycetota bacterium]